MVPFRIDKKGISLDRKVKANHEIMRKGYITVLLLFSTTIMAYSQVGSAGTRASATVVEPITVTKSVDLNFESVAIIVAGSVELVSSNDIGELSNIMLPVTSGTFTAASFILSSTTAYSYKVTVPAAPVELKTGKKNLIVRSFDSDPILNADTGLLAGVFVSVSPMDVTVNYN
jgi:hypothetical protein